MPGQANLKKQLAIYLFNSKRIGLRLVGPALASAIFISLGQSSQPKEIDGFFAYCISNLDGTGNCTNEEDGKDFTCLVVPGAIISCPTRTTASVDCVWISEIQANQAQFWCDNKAEAAMYGDLQAEDNPVNPSQAPTPLSTPKPKTQQSTTESRQRSELIDSFDNAF